MIMRQVPDEEAHDAADDQAGEQLEGAQAVEDEARVVRGRRFGAAVEGVVHLVLLSRSAAWEVYW